jgi:hypothetical protein
MLMLPWRPCRTSLRTAVKFETVEINGLCGAVPSLCAMHEKNVRGSGRQRSFCYLVATARSGEGLLAGFPLPFGEL